ncbi:hypothetical protein [Streptomyces sp.]|uniref:hypothetical protein n=1 Tax=Streptomyces sp. TaxID=1931 RepID=UPI002F41219E
MKTPLMFRQMIANPRRTTLAHLKDASELVGQAAAAGTASEAASAAAPTAEPQRALPQRTANPRRTVLTEPPKPPVAP